MLIKKNDNVLDLCCGDGSYSYLFFSDISNRVDAIDYDEDSISYAKKRYRRDNINFLCGNLLTYEITNNFYDVVIMRAGVAYFTKKQRQLLFQKIHNSLKLHAKFYIGTPLEEKMTFSANQIEVITDLTEFENEFNLNFNIIFKQKTYYQDRININYVLERK